MKYFAKMIYKKYYWKLLRKFPIGLIIEPVNFCNLRCPFCSANASKMQRKRTVMDFKTFATVINQVKGFVNYIHLTNAGEPLLNKNIYKMVEYAKVSNLFVTINTNGTILEREDFRRLFDCGLDYLIFSVDGTRKETYERQRVGANFGEVMSNIDWICSYKKQKNLKKPIVEIQAIVTRYNEDEIEDFKKLKDTLGVDRLRFKSFSLCGHILDEDEQQRLADEFLPRKAESKSRYDLQDGHFVLKESWRNRKCTWWLRNSVILADGRVSMCCFDINGKYCFGNILNSRFTEIWWSPKYLEYRRHLIPDRKTPLCRRCDG